MKEQRHQRRVYQAVKIAILCTVTYLLLQLLPVASGRSEGIDHAVPLAAIALNFAVSGWAVLINKLVHFPALRGYYRTMPWERGLYQALGVRWFKKLVNSGWYRMLWGPVLRRAGKSGSLESLASDMRAAETAHLMALVIVASLTVYSASTGRHMAALWLIGCNLLVNAYPIMLQRYNRGRIQTIMGRTPRRKTIKQVDC
jgi:uncharacterized membrane protein